MKIVITIIHQFTKHYGDFTGTIGRRDFIYFTVPTLLLWVILYNFTDYLIYGAFSLLVIFPVISAVVRRLRDAGLSPWLVFINVIALPLIPLFFIALAILPSKQKATQNIIVQASIESDSNKQNINTQNKIIISSIFFLSAWFFLIPLVSMWLTQLMYQVGSCSGNIFTGFDFSCPSTQMEEVIHFFYAISFLAFISALGLLFAIPTMFMLGKMMWQKHAVGQRIVSSFNDYFFIITTILLIVSGISLLLM